MIVITLTKVPPSLRGDLTKWYQEIQTGVYVGNVSAKIRDLLWDRICQNIGSGQATMVYNAQNELGYHFKTTRIDYNVVDYDGIPLMMHLKEIQTPVKHGFSKAAKMHRAKLMQRSSRTSKPPEVKADFVVVDIETTGLDVARDWILSIGAFKHHPEGVTESFEKFVLSDLPIPPKITTLTGISAEMILSRGEEFQSALAAFKSFVNELPILGYNVHFDEDFIQEAFDHSHLPELKNSFIDLQPVIKRRQKFLDNYRLETVLEKYEIDNQHPHDALNDARATMALALKLIENGDFQI